MSSVKTASKQIEPVVLQSSPGLGVWVRSGALLAADVAAFPIAVLLAFAVDMARVSQPLKLSFVRFVDSGAHWNGWGTVLVLASLLAFFGARGQYTARVSFWHEVGVALGGITIAILCDTFIKVAVYGRPYGGVTMLRWLLFLPVLLVFRQVARSALAACGLWLLRTLVVGDRAAIECAIDALQSEPRLGYEIAGTVDMSDAHEGHRVQSVMEMVRAERAEFVVVAMGTEAGTKERTVISALARARIMFALVPTFADLPVRGFTPQHFFTHDVLMLVCQANLTRPLSRLVKRVFDQVVAFLLLLLMAPFLLVLVVLVRLDGGPAFYAHRRVGAHGRPFRCLKFRTMVVEGDRVLSELLASDPDAQREWAQTQKLRDDPRITRIGRLLRKTSLDEMPQLFNVLCGEMSLVGPRPIVEAEIVRYGGDIDYYLETRPGMTGLWQISGRNELSYGRRVQLDVWYVRNWTLWHDIMILFKTWPAVLRKEGAL